jgi:methylmalonyl-CoA/ethylmalonyl-CoA epimerase
MRFDHVGIFVKDIGAGLRHLQNLLPISKVSQIYQDPLLNVLVQFCYDNDGVCYELVAPFGEKNPVDTALLHNNILNHIAYRSNKFEVTVKHLRDSGCVPLGPAKPAVAFGGKQVIFFLTPLKLIIEIIEG